MTINIAPVPKDPNAKREVKKLTIKITDQAALLAAYPKLEKKVEITKVDKSALRKIVNAYHDVGMEMPVGVEAYYASEKAAEASKEETAPAAGEANAS